MTRLARLMLSLVVALSACAGPAAPDASGRGDRWLPYDPPKPGDDTGNVSAPPTPDSGTLTAAPPDAGSGTVGPYFIAVKDPDVITQPDGLFTVGGQYLDANNGVLEDSWTMLGRWQGADLFGGNVGYDLGAFTGLHVSTPAQSFQRGLTPEDPSSGSPGAQIDGYGAGMLISTWQIPHQYIEGGGYNDMYGYAFSESQRPFVFHDGTDLVLQSTLRVPTFRSSAFVNGGWVDAPAGQTGDYADGQVALFAYLEDASNPSLPPIAYIALAWGNRATSGCGSQGFVGTDYAAGVWFGAAGICTTDISTAHFSSPTESNTFADDRFFRIHITPQNLITLVTRINSASPTQTDASLRCVPGQSCPATGYSTNPENYRVRYAGVIAEAVLLENGAPKNESNDRQVQLGVGIYGVGIYRYHP